MKKTRKKSISYSEKVNKKLMTLCKDSGFCMLTGFKSDYIHYFFDGYNSMKYLKPNTLIKKIGSNSANGFVYELCFERNMYNSYAVFKTTQPNKLDGFIPDNMAYEYMVGQFVNNFLKMYPCFIETYGLFHFKTMQDKPFLINSETITSDVFKSKIVHIDIEKYNVNLKFACKYPEKWKSNPNEWLSSVDISNVMKQYEAKYKCFDFIGPTPIDFDSKDTSSSSGQCVWKDLCSFNLADQIKSGKTKIGIIFNTDDHTGGGEHWISAFINIKKGEMYFYDSAGDKVPPEIKKFSDRVIEQGKKLSPPITFTFDEN